MAEQSPKPPPAPAATVQTDTKLESVGVPTPASLRTLAEDLPERDKVQRAYKDAMLADTAQEEAQAKVIAVNESPNAAETPSGAALKKVTGISNDTERGEKYLREKTAVRWGYVPVQ
jgi:hypothetical protein